MLNFFKKIRQELIDKGNLKRYLLYAIGEILLVVIGILLALQINNWNEKNKARENEKYVLIELESNLQEEQTQIAEMLERRAKAQKAMEQMVNYLPEQQFDIDSLKIDAARMMTYERFFPIRNAYEVSKANGLHITNKKLRTQIAKYYEFEQSKVQKSIQDIEREFINKFEPILTSTKISGGIFGEVLQFRDEKDAELFQEIYELAYGFRGNHSNSYQKIQLFHKANAELLKMVQSELKLF